MNNNFYPQSNMYGMNRTNSYPVQNSIIWVQGIEGAKGYQMPPNSILQLMDSENDGIFYIKISDNIGMSTLRVFKYEEIENMDKPNTKPDLSEYVRKDELQELIKNLYMKQEVSSNEQTISTTQQKSRNSIQ